MFFLLVALTFLVFVYEHSIIWRTCVLLLRIIALDHVREQTVVTLDHDCTNLMYVTNIWARHQSRSVHKDSNTSRISLTSQIFEYVTNLVEAERHLKNSGRPEAAP